MKNYVRRPTENVHIIIANACCVFLYDKSRQIKLQLIYQNVYWYIV